MKLAKLLGHDHPLFAQNIAQLERATGGAGVDVRLLADITERASMTMRRMQLDPADTSAQELYAALQAAVRSGRAHELLAETDYVIAMCEDQPISLNLHDVTDNAHHELPFHRRTLQRARLALRREIIWRYTQHDRTDNTIVTRLACEAGMMDACELLATEQSPRPENTRAPQILAIGDIFTDAFIQLNEEAAKIITESDGSQWLAMPYGQKPPYERVDIVRSVGPSPNAAVSMARLGLDVELMAWIGDDSVGVEALDHLCRERVGTSSIITERGKQTSYWYVLRYQADRTMLVKSEQYAYEWHDPAVVPDWIYLSYIGRDSWQLHEALLEYLDKNPTVKLAFQPGTFHFSWGRDKLAALYARSELVVMNREEAADVTTKPGEDVAALARALHEMGPAAVVITDGPHGSYASYEGKLISMPNYPDIADPVDRTGAGDAFASTIVAALALGKSMEEALSWAPINSMNVVQKLGAQAGLQTQAEIERWLRDAPADYQPRPYPA